MANVVCEGDKFFMIEGLPRSGTTILTNIFNSLSNGFCFSEPLWQLMQDPHGLRLGKLRGSFTPSANPSLMIPSLKAVLTARHFNLGGLKETYRDWQTQCVDIVDDSKLDFRIFILREPAYNFSGWKKTPFGAEYYDVDIFLRNYKNFIRRIESKSAKVPTYVVKYENLCSSDDPISHLGNLLADQLSFSGDLLLENTGYSYGDVKGNNSKTISPARTEQSNLSLSEASACFGISELYSNTKEGRQ